MRRFPRLFLAVLLLAVPDSTRAGGIHLSNVRLNGFPVATGDNRLQAATQNSLCFNIEGYSYSGRQYEPSYAVFEIATLPKRIAQRSEYFVLRLDQLSSMGESDVFKLGHCVEFRTPSTPGRYQMAYSLALMFPSDFTRFDTSAITSHARQHMARYQDQYRRLQVTIAILGVTAAPVVAAAADFATYLRLNGATPAIESHIEPGVDKPAAVFSWFVRPAKSMLQHRYRLYPVEAEWSDWRSDTSAAYFYIAPGGYQFQVMSRSRAPSGEWIEGRQAEYQFVLSAPLIAKPIAKGIDDARRTVTAIDPASLYVRSRALLIGVTRFDDRRLGPLPYTSNDVDYLGSALGRQGFEVTPRKGPLTRAQITDAIEQFARQSARKERLVIYVSTHGFHDPLDASKGYLASSDCHPDRPSTCLSLQEIDGILQPVLTTGTKPVLHLLLLLDACSAGLGVIGKAGQFTESSVAARPGFHVMTAGLADQEAEQDPSLRPPTSTFTYYLGEGLAGKADYTHDGVVSLSELLVFVRFNVALKSNGLQTPMIGRIGGSGEMMFAGARGKQ